jgi:hypothetical protein
MTNRLWQFLKVNFEKVPLSCMNVPRPGHRGPAALLWIPAGSDKYDGFILGAAQLPASSVLVFSFHQTTTAAPVPAWHAD